METYQQQEHLLSELETNLIRTSSGKRLANFIIDRITFYAFIYLLGMVIGILQLDIAYTLQTINPLVDIFVTLALFGIYMGFIEGFFKGRSLGKIITRTKAVNLDGSKINFITAIKRGFSRAVPLEHFSALGNGYPNPWHDRWTDTMVIDLKESTFYN